MPAADSASRSRRAVRSEISSSAATSPAVTRLRACSSRSVATSRSARMSRESHEKRSGDGQLWRQSQRCQVVAGAQEDAMPGLVNPVADEREGLLAFLAQQRLVLRTAAYGLTDDQAAAAPSASALSVGGLIKHVTQVERFWIGIVRGEDRERRGEQYADGFRLLDGETLTAA